MYKKRDFFANLHAAANAQSSVKKRDIKAAEKEEEKQEKEVKQEFRVDFKNRVEMIDE